jgi:hypothetical protein
MNRGLVFFCLAFIALPLLLPTAVQAQHAWIVDILANPSGHWNRTVVLVGQVQNVVANPAGTSQGTYTLLDDSCPNPIAVRTNDLPPVGKTFLVTGIVVKDTPTATEPILNEVSRTTPGTTASTLYLLIGAGVLFLGLLMVFIVLLSKPRKAAAAPVETMRPSPQETVRPVARPVSAAPPAVPQPATDLSKTAMVPPGSTPAAGARDKMQVFMRPGAGLVGENGPDKGREFPLSKQATMIGRAGARKNDIEVADETVSEEQASIFYNSTRKVFSIVNESANNPTTVNGQPISGPRVLEQGALIELGKTAFRFRIS